MDSSLLLARIESKFGLPRGYLKGAWGIESGYGKNLLNRKTGAAGHFQFMPATAKRYGLTDPNDLEASATAAARLARDSMQTLSRAGAPATSGNLYLVHQQGPGGASALLSHANEPAVSVLSRVYGSEETARRAITLNGGSLNMSAGDFANHVASQFYSRADQKQPSYSALPPPPTNPGRTPGFFPQFENTKRVATNQWNDLLTSLGVGPKQLTTAAELSNPPSETPSTQRASFGDVIASFL